MRILISAVGTRGDVQPALALAVEARALGCQVRLCLPPNFTAWAEGLGFEARPMGVEMRAPRPGTPPPVVPDLIADQFETMAAAAEGCVLIVGAGAHQYAARSVAQARGVDYAVAVYAPVAIPSPELAPPLGAQPLTDGRAANLQAWTDYRRRWDARSLDRVNAGRRRLRLRPLEDDVYGHILTGEPWLASDPILGPAPCAPGLDVLQTGAWMLADETPLPEDLVAFLEAGEAPVYFGFGSMPAPAELGRVVIEAARAVGRRVVLSAGWGDLAPIDKSPDCLAIGEVNHAALFARVAAVAHHGGAGTTAAAALAGAPQVVAAMFSDQFYWGSRVEALGIGATLPAAGLAVEALARALETALAPSAVGAARAVAAQVARDGAATAARLLVEALG